MAGAEHPQAVFWPLFGLTVRTPVLEISTPREDEFAALIQVINDGIHDPASTPFSNAFTDRPRPERDRESAQWWWRQRAAWTSEKWNYTGAVRVDGQIVGVQDMTAEHFAQVRSVSTGSWLGQAYQGRGLGREMREAILHLAFAGLGPVEAHSEAYHDNAASLGTSRSVGYSLNGEHRGVRRDGVDRLVNVRIDRDAWKGRRRDDIEIIGLEACYDMFVTPPTTPPATP